MAEVVPEEPVTLADVIARLDTLGRNHAGYASTTLTQGNPGLSNHYLGLSTMAFRAAAMLRGEESLTLGVQGAAPRLFKP